MNLVALVTYYNADWRFVVPLYSLVAAGLLLDPKKVLDHWLFWSLVTAILLAHVVITWPQEGNNYYLYFYVSLTTVIGCLTNSFNVVQQNARLLIGLVFAFAAGWKISSGSYFGGEYFRYSLLVEPRTSQLALWFFPEWSKADTARDPNFMLATQVLTWSGFLLELSIAAAFLISIPMLSRSRNVLMFIFITFAYLLLPVPAFGMTLTSLGYIQANGWGRHVYLWFFILMPLTTIRTFLN